MPAACAAAEHTLEQLLDEIEVAEDFVLYIL